MKTLLIALLVVSITALRVGSSPSEDFVKGFLRGIKETKSPQEMIKCMKSLDFILEELHQSIEYIKKFTPEDVIHGVTLMFKAMMDLISILRPCSKDYPVVTQLINAMMNFHFRVLIEKIKTHIMDLVGYIGSAINDFNMADYEEFGRDIGKILYVLFLK